MYASTYKYKFNQKMPPSLPSPQGGGGGKMEILELKKIKKLGTKWWSH